MDDFTNAFGSEDEAQTHDDVASIQEDLVDEESQLARILGVDLLDEADDLQDIVNVCTENVELYLDEYIDDPEGQFEDAEEVVVPPAPAWDLPDETSTQFAERLGIIRGPGWECRQGPHRSRRRGADERCRSPGADELQGRAPKRRLPICLCPCIC